jgi:hypothetical protein
VLHSSEARGNGKWRGAKSELLRLLAARGNGAEAEEARARSRLACGSDRVGVGVGVPPESIRVQPGFRVACVAHACATAKWPTRQHV